MTIKEHINLAEYTTFRVGGPARFFVIVNSEAELEQAVDFAGSKSLPVFMLGWGSNILVSDDGFNGLVIKNEIRGISVSEYDQHVLCTAGAGENWDSIVAECVRCGVSGLELLSGIPGTVGAAPVQNIGAYGTSVESVIEHVRIYDFHTQKFHELPKSECRFSYRSSVFKDEYGRYAITSVTFRLSRRQPALPSYPDLIALFSKAASPTVDQIRSAVIATRASKGMVIMPGFSSYKSAGSFFKNPVINKSEFEKLSNISCRAPWQWELPDSRVKVSAACLIQQAGFGKGYREGNVGLSPLHTLAIVNYGDASAKEIKDFSKKIQSKVEQDYGIFLEPEVQFIGF